MNELPFRHLFKYLDCETSGPKGFTGLLGKELQNSVKLPVVKFNKIKCELPIIITNDF